MRMQRQALAMQPRYRPVHTPDTSPQNQSWKSPTNSDESFLNSTTPFKIGAVIFVLCFLMIGGILSGIIPISFFVFTQQQIIFDSESIPVCPWPRAELNHNTNKKIRSVKVMTTHIPRSQPTFVQKQHFERGIQFLWDAAKDDVNRDMFAYSDVASLPRRTIYDSNFDSSGGGGGATPFFEVYLNTHRVEKLQHSSNADKPKSDISVAMEWNEDKFNFYKLTGKDILTSIHSDISRRYDGLKNNLFECKKFQFNTEQHLILANRYPIGNYSGLFVPMFWDSIPQIMTHDLLNLGLQLSHMFATPKFRIGYNSMGAMASVNHFHFQFWSIESLVRSVGRLLPIEIAPRELVSGGPHKAYQIYSIRADAYPIPTLVYQVASHSKLARGIVDLTVLLEPMWYCIAHLIELNIPHTLLINRYESYIFVRKPEQSSQYPIFYGFSDVSGWITILKQEEYSSLTYQQLWDDMKQTVSVDHPTWLSVRDYCGRM